MGWQVLCLEDFTVFEVKSKLVKKKKLLLSVTAMVLVCSASHSFAQSSQSVSLVWDPSPSSAAVGYVVRRGTASGGYSYATNVTGTSARIGGLQSGQRYYFAVTARDAAGNESLPSNELSYVVPTGATNSPNGNVTNAVLGLPAPWQTVNIGPGGSLIGGASESNGAFTVQGAGSIGGRTDSFRFVHQPLSGDGEIVARVDSTAANGDNPWIGVMMRESLAANSRYALMGISQGLKYRWQRRSNSGGNTSSTTSVVSTPPNAWTRLVRSGSTLTGYTSTNGLNWTELASTKITMATNIYVGLVVASGDATATNRAVFSRISITP